MLRTLSLALALGAPLTGAPALPSVEELVARNLEARGGLAKLKAVNSIRLTGRMTIGPGMEAPTTLEMKRPSKMRLDLSFQGLTATQVYDGQGGWQVMPFQGNKDPQPLTADDLKDAAEQADMDGPLADYAAKGNTIELLGKEPVDGKDAYKLRLTLKNGSVQALYLDASSALEIKGESMRRVQGAQIETEQRIGDYRNVEGLWIPHSFENGPKGRPEKQKITIEKVELNVPLDDARFAMPAVSR